MGLGPAELECYSSPRRESVLIVRCENCQTEFALDGSQVTSDGVTVRCSVCAHVFRVAPPQGGPSDQPWQIRTVENRLFTAVDLAMLYQWVKEGRLHPDDQVSRTGHAWLKLGEIPEFSRLFTDFEGLPSVFRKVEGPSGITASAGAFAPRSPDAPVSSPRLAPPGGGVSRPTQPWGTPVTPPSEIEATSAGGPGSMLGAVTRHASGSTEIASVNAGDHDDGRLDELGPPSTVAPIPAMSRSSNTAFEDTRYEMHGSTARDESAANRPGFPKAAAFFGAFSGVVFVTVAGVGLAYALGVRLPMTDSASAESSGAVELSVAVSKQLGDAAAARDRLSMTELATTELAIQRALDGGGLSPSERASLSLAQADILATRALARRVTLAIASTRGGERVIKPGDKDQAITPPTLDEVERARMAEQATADTARARAALSGVFADVAEPAHVVDVRARVRLAEGGDLDELATLLGEAGPEREVHLLVKAAPLWRGDEVAPGDDKDLELEATVPEGLEAALQRFSPPTGLSRAVLALVRARGDDELGATTAIRAAVATAADHPLAVFVAADPEPVVGSDTASEQPGGSSAAADAPNAPAKPTGSENRSKKNDDGDRPIGKIGSKSGPVSVDRLVDQGCSAVEKHRPAAGVPALKEALDRAPRNIDGLVCLASAYAAMSNLQSAQVYFKRALAISPRHRTALAGAARVADRMGLRDQALRYYRRLLTIDSTNATAQRYVDDYGGKGSGSRSGDEKPKSTPSAGGDKPSAAATDSDGAEAKPEPSASKPAPTSPTNGSASEGGVVPQPPSASNDGSL